MKQFAFNFKRNWISISVLGILLFVLSSGPAGLSANQDITVIDDFNDGDATDWGFFGGNEAGGGGGAADDRPQEGSHYFSTGWGGQGSESVFYGG
ncbi:MAG: hypothetical protein AAGD96_35440, partial [Chloroflexota bacterium]